ncbi:hypothetical protein LWP59_08715 [Amycolatopsis acidiphila]|uniref:Uncharacterized protein n=1 Tax=Amycolatopsis acidiphila TaxID=715473 RepID=A0A558A4X8_9PSEU|nr:hypothetical protein [Amycolatopsis acidiphila]TVT19323.1 hypothetical protein FNH06_24500 [Amycolatopsis acidiphila]UIJ61687.1 hypothetical protein LWP59_08715 [Amycolatopsis acidiphila]GHG58410.1 hypothetical protein GCM10017788_11060 [Amycolatopsis acidiphila]
MRTTGRNQTNAAMWGGIDAGALIRGCSQGFTALVLGGLFMPLAVRIPVVGPFWLTVVAVVAFAVAGTRIGGSRWPPLQGAAAAVGSYILVLPLVLAGGAGSAEFEQIGLTSAAALVVGAVAGLAVALRRRGRT